MKWIYDASNSAKKEVIFSRTDTQRVVVSYTDTSCLLSKEWRKTVDDEWLVGKSIDIPRDKLQRLIEVLGKVQGAI